ncbi:MAG: DNA polymerase III subunit beta [Clostridia bacterium]|nr:DNA polymerase III subunit beta [Clostridia bacterium]
MKFTSDRAVLFEAIANASRAVSVKNPNAALEGILLDAKEVLTISGFDLEMGIECKTEAMISEQGGVIVNAKLFSEILRKLPDGIVSVVCDDKYNVTIRCGLSEFSLIGMPMEEFPEIPKFSSERSFEIQRQKLKKLISQTLYAVATSDVRPIQTGSLFEVENGELTVVSCDGFRLAVAREDLSAEIENCSFVVQGRTLAEILKMLDDSDRNVVVTLSKRHITFAFDQIMMVSRLLEGEFWNYRNSIPKECRITVKARTRELFDAVDRASLMISDRVKSHIKLGLEGDEINVSCNTVLGNGQDVIKVQSSGGSLVMGFNSRFLLDMLRVCQDEEIRIELNSALLPMVVKPNEGNAFLFLIVPVRL